MKLRYTLLPIILLMTACVSFTIKDTQDAIVTAKATLAGVNNTIAALVNNKQISSDTAEKMGGDADKAKALLETAQGLMNQNLPQDAMEALKAANQILLALQRQLEQEQRK